MVVLGFVDVFVCCLDMFQRRRRRLLPMAVVRAVGILLGGAIRHTENRNCIITEVVGKLLFENKKKIVCQMRQYYLLAWTFRHIDVFVCLFVFFLYLINRRE